MRVFGAERLRIGKFKPAACEVLVGLVKIYRAATSSAVQLQPLAKSVRVVADVRVKITAVRQ
jgi:hypothetical protein